MEAHQIWQGDCAVPEGSEGQGQMEVIVKRSASMSSVGYLPQVSEDLVSHQA